MSEPDQAIRWRVPSVEFRVQAQWDRGRQRWFWKPADAAVPPCRESVETPKQLRRMLLVLGGVAGALLGQDAEVLRTRVTGHWLPSGGTAIGCYEWCRSGETGQMVPVQDPWVLWPDARRGPQGAGSWGPTITSIAGRLYE